jgi:hypothetical protein
MKRLIATLRQHQKEAANLFATITTDLREFEHGW